MPPEGTYTLEEAKSFTPCFGNFRRERFSQKGLYGWSNGALEGRLDTDRIKKECTMNSAKKKKKKRNMAARQRGRLRMSVFS